MESQEKTTQIPCVFRTSTSLAIRTRWNCLHSRKKISTAAAPKLQLLYLFIFLATQIGRYKYERIWNVIKQNAMQFIMGKFALIIAVICLIFSFCDAKTYFGCPPEGKYSACIAFCSNYRKCVNECCESPCGKPFCEHPDNRNIR